MLSALVYLKCSEHVAVYNMTFKSSNVKWRFGYTLWTSLNTWTFFFGFYSIICIVCILAVSVLKKLYIVHLLMIDLFCKESRSQSRVVESRLHRCCIAAEIRVIRDIVSAGSYNIPGGGAFVRTKFLYKCHYCVASRRGACSDQFCSYTVLCRRYEHRWTLWSHSTLVRWWHSAVHPYQNSVMCNRGNSINELHCWTSNVM